MYLCWSSWYLLIFPVKLDVLVWKSFTALMVEVAVNCLWGCLSCLFVLLPTQHWNNAHNTWSCTVCHYGYICLIDTRVKALTPYLFGRLFCFKLLESECLLCIIVSVKVVNIVVVVIILSQHYYSKDLCYNQWSQQFYLLFLVQKNSVSSSISGRSDTSFTVRYQCSWYRKVFKDTIDLLFEMETTLCEGVIRPLCFNAAD